jgi:ribosomal protein S18 acetylase RimI-like enzyme
MYLLLLSDRAGRKERGMIRPTIPQDTDTLLALTAGTGLFLPADLETLREVLDDYHAAESTQAHRAITYERDGQVVGFAYYAPAAMTDGTWYLWWIVVSKQIQAKGIGGELLQYLEEDIRAQKGRMLLLETSSLPSYELTRRFYLKKGYEQAAVLDDYYAEGHGMVIYRKRFVPKTRAPSLLQGVQG